VNENGWERVDLEKIEAPELSKDKENRLLNEVLRTWVYRTLLSEAHLTPSKYRTESGRGNVKKKVSPAKKPLVP